ncbi:phloem protein 2-like protein [Tanacetum coccineum]|uniref:Phloem protein 2-like protein n=1 Tax=Tanacetum coccineum TaxID=301880 RepID=A0ABQ5C997_9ASTR
MFPWLMRLQFCLEAARGLKFLHNGNKKNHLIIHGNIKSSNILISQDGVGIIGDFGLSTYKYNDTHKLTKEYDVYSFGLVLFEVLSGALTHFKISKDDPKFLPDIVKRGYNQKELDTIIDPMLRQEFEKCRSLIGNRSAESLNMVSNIAYQCFQEKAKGLPTMADIVEELDKAYKYHVESLEQRQEDEDNSKMENLKHLKIPLKEIFSATNGFADSRMIIWGGFGGVYVQSRTLPCRCKKVCQKDRSNLLLNSMATLEEKAKLLLSGDKLRLIKEGKNSGKKSTLEGMIGDVGLSITVKNTDYWLLNITPVGTGGYVGPKYLKRGILSKQSDMYSFGVVLLEVLCGRFATTLGTLKDRASLVDMAECHLSNNQPSQIIGDYLRKSIKDEKLLDSVKTFAAITHECLHSTETHCLIMADVLKELKKALVVHVSHYTFMTVSNRGGNHIDNFNDKRIIRSGASGEVVKLSHYVHKNIITLRGYCEEGDEKIIIIDHAINGSLDKHLHKSTLTWELRLKISIGAAKGLNVEL